MTRPTVKEAIRRYTEGQEARILAIHLESANNELAMTWWSLHELRYKGHSTVPSLVLDPPDWRCSKCDRHPPVYGRRQKVVEL